MRRVTGIVLLLVSVGASPGTTALAAEPQYCSYQTYTWNVRLRKVVAQERVHKPYAALSPAERGEFAGCSVCEQDQQVLQLPGLAPVRVCRRLAPALQRQLQELIAAGAPLWAIRGYRVGRTRGPADAQGNRTQFSNHAYGIAIDINPEQNGLYDHCLAFGPHCRLLRGGPWRAGQRGSLSAEGEIVRALRAIGLQWGGQIEGRQKDFMHFSPTGY